mmetsp:Transcript_2834/g.7496  ORF Transcript_2834/g.7496 Transcript_2834/m.7496 type:complete len:201 (-) Transcript_2834:29-631(-)
MGCASGQCPVTIACVVHRWIRRACDQSSGWRRFWASVSGSSIIHSPSPTSPLAHTSTTCRCSSRAPTCPGLPTLFATWSVAQPGRPSRRHSARGMPPPCVASAPRGSAVAPSRVARLACSSRNFDVLPTKICVAMMPLDSTPPASKALGVAAFMVSAKWEDERRTQPKQQSGVFTLRMMGRRARRRAHAGGRAGLLDLEF